MKYFQKNSTATISLKIWKLCWFASIAGWSEESEHQNFQNLQKTFLLTFTAKDKKKPNGQKARQQRSQFYRCAPLPSPPFSSHLIKPPTCHKGAHANKIGTISWTNRVALVKCSAPHIPLIDNKVYPVCSCGLFWCFLATHFFIYEKQVWSGTEKSLRSHLALWPMYEGNKLFDRVDSSWEESAQLRS